MLRSSALADAADVQPRTRRASPLLRALVLRLLTCVAAVGVCSVPSSAYAASGSALEYAVKAAYLYKFGFFVEWPPATLAGASAPMNLCITGSDPFGPTLEEVIGDQRIQDHPINVRRTLAEDGHADCHILFIGGSDVELIDRIVASVSGLGVLTVTDLAYPTDTIGIINFVVKDNRVRFDIDERAAHESGLVISSKLLALALNVRHK